MRGGTIRPGALLASPVFFGSIALLLLNDRVLKSAWPGLVTGKLSDIAGVGMMAILLAALLRRRGLAFGLTTMSFTLLKVVPVSAVWAAPILGGITRRDPTDLVVLLTLVPLWRWIGDRQIVGFVAPTDRDLGRWTVPLQVALVGAAVFATSATSSDCGLGGVSTLGVDGDRVLAQAGFDTFESGDFGRTWSKLSESELSDRFEGIDTEGFWSYSGRECTAAGPCFIGSLANGGVDEGAHPGIVIRRVEGDRTSDLLSVTLAQLDQVESMMPTEACGAVWISDGVGLDSPDGEHVLMPVGTAGVLHRTPDGEWEWAAVGIYGFEPNEVDDEPLGIPVASTADAVPFAWGTWVARAMPVAVILGTAFMAMPLARLARRNRRDASAARWWVLGLSGAQILVGAWMWKELPTDDADGFTGLSAIAIAFVLGVGGVIGLISIAGMFGRQPDDHWMQPPNPSDRLG